MSAPFTIEEYVRWSDTDPAGIIYFGAYLRFCEIAESELFRSLGFTYAGVLQEHGVVFPRAQLHLDFHHPVRLDDRLQVAAYLVRLGGASFTLQFDIVDLGAARIAASGHMVLVCTTPEAIRPRPLPDAVRERLAAHVRTPEDARAALGVAGPKRAVQGGVTA